MELPPPTRGKHGPGLGETRFRLVAGVTQLLQFPRLLFLHAKTEEGDAVNNQANNDRKLDGNTTLCTCLPL